MTDIREVAEGKCKSWVISYSSVAPTQSSFGEATWYKADGTPFVDWNDFQTYIGVNATCMNSSLNSNNSSVNASGNCYLIADTLIIVRVQKWEDQGETLVSDLKQGDNIWVKELEVADRWVAISA